MPKYIYAVSAVKYGTSTGTNTMPASGDMTSLPNTVKGSINLEEAEGTMQKFYVDQRAEPIKTIKTEESEMEAVMSFYDLSYATIAAIKGGSGDASGYTPATGFTLVEKAIEITMESGEIFDFYNSFVAVRIMGAGGRDAMFSMEMKCNPQLTADLAGSWKVREPV